MTDYTKWEILRRRVAVAGRVTDAGGKPVKGARVTIVWRAEEPDNNSQGSTAEIEQNPPFGRMEEVYSEDDGLYYFMDIPGGRYALEVWDVPSGDRESKSITIPMHPGETGKPALIYFKLGRR